MGNSDVILRVTGKQHQMLAQHLFPGDGLEAVALLLCGRRRGHGRNCLSVMQVLPIPYEHCQREMWRITWPTSFMESFMTRAVKEGLAIVKIHSHPGGFDRFSDVDDASDTEFFHTMASWTESTEPHGSVVMLPHGRMFGRYAAANGEFTPIDMIAVAGETIEYMAEDVDQYVPDFADRHAQVLGDDTIGCLRRLRCAVIGCSGTGSPTIEQLFRLGIGDLVLVDPDTIGPENLNRIINSRGWHAQQKSPKVEVMARAIEDTGLGTTVTALKDDLCSRHVIEAVAACDVIFGCVDSVFARHVLNKVASTYCIPYIDIGVGIKADAVGGIAHVSGAVNYLQPDCSSLLSRQLFSLQDVQSDILRRSDPTEYASRLEVGYIKGADVSRPAVMSVNTIFSGYGVFEFLSRIHPLRDDGNSGHASQRWSLSGGFALNESDGERCPVVNRYLGRGDMEPLLGMPELSLATESIHVAT